ncbi:MAG: AAA family ATPase [Metamycoplasmataceae bacterium]
MSNKINSLKVIENAKLTNSFSHAYLFFGELGVDVFNSAFEAIKLIICEDDKCMQAKTLSELNYPDLLVVNPENNLISKESIISIIKNMSNSSLVMNKKKILLIKDIDLGNKYSLNSLLKYMEEPSENTHIIMTTNRVDFLLPTIKSRAQNIMIRRQTISEIMDELISNNIDEKYIRLFANIFPNSKKAKEIDIKKFEITYSEIMKALELGITNSEKMKIHLYDLITKDNILYSISILEYFYFQVLTVIEDDFPLFPNHKKLINEYKKKEIDYSAIQAELNHWKKTFMNKGNFNLQKENLLIKLVNIYEE